MKTVYRTTNPAHGHLVASLLEQAGLRSLVHDEHFNLTGHALGNVRVTVPPENEAAARELIADWEKQVPDEAPVAEVRAPAVRRAPSGVALVLGLGVEAVVKLGVFVVPGAR